MARDRDRARRRRAERKADAVDSPLGEGTAAPDPLDNASAGVDQARLAEAGATPPPVGDRGEREPGVYADELEDDVRSAPDAVEGDAIARRRGVQGEPEPRPGRGRVFTFLGHCVDELRRVQWPNRRQVGQATAVVLGFVVIAGGYLGLLDALWQPLIEAIL
jgi:preprotein translocase SecE subunit